MATKAELEQKLLEMEARMRVMMELMAAKPQPVISPKGPQVGIRNVSNYTIGIRSPVKGEPDISLHAENPAQYDPSSCAAISQQAWLAIRNSSWVRKGMVLRDDSVLGEGMVTAPEDRPEELPHEARLNAIADPFEWIESRTEEELRDDIAKITSEPSLRRLAAAIDRKIWLIGEEKYKDDEQRAKKAYRDLPAKYKDVESQVKDRLIDDFQPNAPNRANESELKVRF